MKPPASAKPPHSFHVYQLSSKEDFFYNHPNSVLLTFFGAVAGILFFLMSVAWIATRIW
jgi:hypothetical protein